MKVFLTCAAAVLLLAGALGAVLTVLSARGFPHSETPLGRAAESGTAAEVGALLSRHLDPDEKDSHGLTPLVRASRRGDASIVKCLLDGGADPNLRDGPVTRPGWTPLMNAVHKGQTEVARLLLDAGARVGEPGEDGTTALMLASGDADPRAVRMLLDAGADPHPGEGGSAALTNAVASGRLEIVRALLARAPDLRLESGLRGRAALWSARLTGHSDVIGLLREASSSGARNPTAPSGSSAGRARSRNAS